MTRKAPAAAWQRPFGRVAAALFMTQALLSCASPDLRNVGVVEPGLLLRSGTPTALGLAGLRDEYGVQTVVNLMDHDQGSAMTAALALGLDYVPLPTSTYRIEREHLVAVLAVIRQAEAAGRTPVLVHCRSGQDRTGTAIALFRSIEQDWAARRALTEMERYRHWTHEVLFPHLRGVVTSAEEFEEVWEAAIARTGDVPVIRPPAPWRPGERPPYQAIEKLPLEVREDPAAL